MATIVWWRYTLAIRRFVLRFDNRRRVYVRTIKAILKMEEEVQRGILSLGIALDNECHKLMKTLTRKFGPTKADGKPDSVLTSWRFDDETDMVTVIYDSREQEDYLLENIMIKHGAWVHGRIAQRHLFEHKHGLKNGVNAGHVQMEASKSLGTRSR
ncbi:hypothetical protein Hanom_Chr01g00048381 [Helianthus anomalus]